MPLQAQEKYKNESYVSKLAKVIVQYSLDLQSGETFILMTNPEAEELNLAVIEEAVKAGAHVNYHNEIPEYMEILLKYGNDEQIKFISPFENSANQDFETTMYIGAPKNKFTTSGVDPDRLNMFYDSRKRFVESFMKRIAEKALKWCVTAFPTEAIAQDARMSLSTYKEFFYSACKLDQPDPVQAWKDLGEQQEKLIHWLKGKDEVRIKGPYIDLRMSIKGRTFMNAEGKNNFPDGEIYTGPVEESVNGWVKFTYPALYSGNEMKGIQLWFEDGKVVKEKAEVGEEYLTGILDMDKGARYLGELGIGTNEGIQTFTKVMLFDEKMAKTIHLALGSGYPETGSKNVSAIHWDLLCDMKEGEIIVDGETFYKDGLFLH
ncbi:hypothetical protein BVY01_01985 [bacterium I07]|nr:hypothetical protein BVY01_01985 [bacterium I07]